MSPKRGVLLMLAFFLCLSFYLEGCSFLPVQTAKAYLKDLYRRIPYKVEGNYRVVDIFYATDREVNEKEDLSLTFRPRLAENMTYGTVNVKIDPRLKIGRMLPRMFKLKGLMGVQEVNKAEESVFMKQLADAVNASPHNSLLVLVFGYKDGFEITALKAAYFAYLLDVNTPVLLFDWPGDQPVSFSGYKRAEALAVESGPYLGELLAKIIREVKPEKLWVKSSSLGCQVVCDAFEHMYKYDDLADSDLEIEHVVLAAPDVGEDEFDERFKDEITALSKKVTTYVSSDDTALLVSGFIDQEQKLGLQNIEVKEHVRAHKQFEETKDMLYLKSLSPDKIALVDVTPINKASYGHGYYLESPEFFDDLYMRIFDKAPHANRRLYLLKVKDNTDYWVLRGGK